MVVVVDVAIDFVVSVAVVSYYCRFVESLTAGMTPAPVSLCHVGTAALKTRTEKHYLSSWIPNTVTYFI